ncbi:MAG: diguanylate cyclase [Planctomycetes bacterium]|nr:diguanylate cyclase [Planctomycetota bacterium]
MRALVVDDDEVSLDIVSNILSEHGYEVSAARDGCEALGVVERGVSQLVVTDWEMPRMGGLELCRRIRDSDFSGYIYIIMLTGHHSEKQRLQGIYAGADDFLTKPLNTSELLICLKRANRILSLETRDLALFAMAKLAESRDPETGAHIERVQSYTRLLAQALSSTAKYRNIVNTEFVRLVHQTSPLHDIGKVGIPDAILQKRGKLTVDEYAVMKKHTELGARTLEAALERFPHAKFLHMARDIAAYHHEKYDGTGYPKGLTGEEIPLAARIVALADVYDALTTRRPYKDALSHYKARVIILKERCCHFDSDVVDAFLQCEEEFIAIKEKLTDVEEERRAPRAVPVHILAEHDPAIRILIVQENPEELKVLTDFLKLTNHEVLAASNGEDALRLFGEQSPRVVITGCTMPGIDGLELCKRIRACELGQCVHIVMLCPTTEKSNVVDAFEAGADDFVTTDVDHAELLARVRAGLRTARLHDELSRRTEASQQISLQLAQLNKTLQEAADTDHLTGLCSRRYGIARLDEQISLADRYCGPLSIAIIDIDHFKNINDTLGHDAGDAVLVAMARLFRENVRATDIVCRIGGEEFLIIFPAQTTGEASISLERCRQAIADERFPFGEHNLAVTVSIGIAGHRRREDGCSRLLRDADKALYDAKNSGRNRICAMSSECEGQPA